MSNFKPSRLLTIPVLSLKDNKPVIVRFDDVMHTGKTMPVKEGEKSKDPATIARVTNMDTGEVHELIVNAVLKGVLHDNYPDNEYVGKVFSLEALPKREGKDYKGMKVFEMTDETTKVASPSVKTK